MPAQGSDQWLNLEMEEPGNTEDRYIQALEVKPLKGASVIHHADASAVPAGAVANGMTLEGSELLVEYAIGKAGETYPEGNAKRLAKGSGVNLNLHLHSNGEEIAVNAALGMKFYPKGYQPKLVQFSRTMPSSSLRDQETIDIPPGASDVRTDSYSYVTRPMLITAYQPHMHFRGKRQCLEVIYPPASSEGGPTFAKSEILNCANFRFNWHLQYTYADDVQPLLPAGSVLHLMSWHDNSPAFKANPDPTAWIGYGRRSTDEMALAWMEYAYLTPEQYSAAVEARKKLKSSGTQNQ